MLINYSNILRIIPTIQLELFGKEYSFLIKTNLLKNILLMLKNHYKYQFKVLTCISGVDYPNNTYRFQIVYELLSIRFNSRTRVKCFANEIIPISSVEVTSSTVRLVYPSCRNLIS